MKQIEFLKENIKPEDIIVYSNIGNGGVIAAFFPDNKQYFYNGAHWDVDSCPICLQQWQLCNRLSLESPAVHHRRPGKLHGHIPLGLTGPVRQGGCRGPHPAGQSGGRGECR